MSARTPDEKLHELIGLFQAMDEGGAPPPLLGVLVGETYVALTEMLAMRAEVERLRGIEAMVLALKRRNFSCPCEDCINRPDVRGEGECLYDKLHAALDATKQEPGT